MSKYTILAKIVNFDTKFDKYYSESVQKETIATLAAKLGHSRHEQRTQTNREIFDVHRMKPTVENIEDNLSMTKSKRLTARVFYFQKSVFKNFCQKSKFWSKIEILVKNRNFGQNRPSKPNYVQRHTLLTAQEDMIKQISNFEEKLEKIQITNPQNNLQNSDEYLEQIRNTKQDHYLAEIERQKRRRHVLVREIM